MTATPPSIAWFSYCWLASLALDCATSVLTWTEPDALPNWAGVLLVVISSVLSLVLWQFVMRYRAKPARWIITVITAIVLVSLLSDPTLLPVTMPAGSFAIVSAALSAVATLLLFLEPSRRWFARDVDYRETF